jgi:hypothetical protein
MTAITAICKMLYYRKILSIGCIGWATCGAGQFAKIRKNSYMPHGAKKGFESCEEDGTRAGLFLLVSKKKPVSKAMKVC